MSITQIETEWDDLPRFIFVSECLRTDVLGKVPEIAPLISDCMCDDTVIVVERSHVEAYVEDHADESSKGVIHVNESGFYHLLGVLKGFLQTVKGGVPTKVASEAMIRMLSEGKTA